MGLLPGLPVLAVLAVLAGTAGGDCWWGLLAEALAGAAGWWGRVLCNSNCGWWLVGVGVVGAGVAGSVPAHDDAGRTPAVWLSRP